MPVASASTRVPALTLGVPTRVGVGALCVRLGAYLLRLWACLLVGGGVSCSRGCLRFLVLARVVCALVSEGWWDMGCLTALPLLACCSRVGGLLVLTLRCVGAGACALACARRAWRLVWAGHGCPAHTAWRCPRCVAWGERREKGGVLAGW